MSSPRIRTALRPLAVLSVIGLSVVGCGGSDSEDPLDDGDPSTPVDQGTVVPPVSVGVDGGEPVDNLNDGESQQPAQGGSDSDLESNNGG
ncbi:MAG: hypothetical protein ABJH68_13940 [Ilumatobacter sp.]|uniref:hypothetical protein n=1 Tax=Ilumatobacter sp. TaxID=1967498 RepID=UPI003299C444